MEKKVERKENLEVVVSIACNGDEWKKYTKKEFNKVMLVSTGALLSPTSTLQKQTIPSVAHGVVIVNE